MCSPACVSYTASTVEPALSFKLFFKVSKTIQTIDLKIDGDFVDVDYHFADVPFQRIRRITGYLVGTLDRFNDAKRAEVRDRVKHGLASPSVSEQ